MICLNCGKLHKNKKFCSLNCANSYNNKFRIVKEETIKKISDSKKGKGHPHTDETKLKISQKRKEYLRNHDNNWVNMKVSKPCEYLKNILREMNIFFIEELMVLNDRYFRIDIALPEYKIGIEINGNQHYKKINDLILDDYYEERHKLIENNGWKLIELYYKTVYDKNIKNIILDIISNKRYEYNIETKKYIINCINKKLYCKKCNNEIIYGHKCKICKRKYTKNIKSTSKSKLNDLLKKIKKLKKLKERKRKIDEKYNLCNCGNKKLYKSSMCIICSNKLRNSENINKPPYEQLIKEINELGYCAVGRKYNVSDNTIRKWKIRYRNKKYGTTIDYLNNIKNESFIRNKPKIDLILNSNIDFSKFGWVKKVSILINIKHQKVNKWMKKYMNDFYYNNCFIRNTPISERSSKA